MNNSLNLLLYVDKTVCFRDEVRLLIAKCGIPFIELDGVAHLFSAVKQSNKCIIVVAGQQLFETITSFRNTTNELSHIFFVLKFNPLISVKNFCTCETLYKLEEYLNINIRLKNIDMRFPNTTLMHRLIRCELNNLDISKKYAGFKYIVDLIDNVLKTKITNPYSSELFKYVASINVTTADIVERNIRHMLTTTWKNSTKFRSAILPKKQDKTSIPAKDILNGIIDYLKQII